MGKVASHVRSPSPPAFTDLAPCNAYVGVTCWCACMCLCVCVCVCVRVSVLNIFAADGRNIWVRWHPVLHPYPWHHDARDARWTRRASFVTHLDQELVSMTILASWGRVSFRQIPVQEKTPTHTVLGSVVFFFHWLTRTWVSLHTQKA